MEPVLLAVVLVLPVVPAWVDVVALGLNGGVAPAPAWEDGSRVVLALPVLLAVVLPVALPVVFCVAEPVVLPVAEPVVLPLVEPATPVVLPVVPAVEAVPLIVPVLLGFDVVVPA